MAYRDPNLQNWLEKEKIVAPKLKIGGQHEVTEIKRDAAQVGCTRVTRAEVEQLLKEMDSAPREYDFEIESVPAQCSGFLNFNIRNTNPGWIAATEKADAERGMGGFGVRMASFCLNSQNAEKLFKFLADELGYYISKYPQQVQPPRNTYGW